MCEHTSSCVYISKTPEFTIWLNKAEFSKWLVVHYYKAIAKKKKTFRRIRIKI